MKLGSLFSGYGGLEMGVQAVLDADTAWHVEFDDAPSRILAHHWPNIPNYGDITTVDWSSVEPVDILTGGFPCQDVSLAGVRRGLRPDTRSGLWSHFAQAIDALHPELVIVENVRGLLSAEAHSDLEPDPWDLGDGNVRPALRALGAVLGDLADLGYDAEWCGVRAADAGAPHGRFRVFVAAYPAHVREHGSWDARDGRPESADRRSTTADPDSAHSSEIDARDDRLDSEWETLGGRPVVSSRVGGDGRAAFRDAAGSPARGRVPAARVAGDRASVAWGVYEPAIRRWERALGRVAPAPTETQRLSPAFVEWMMGLPAGHVTDVGLTRTEQLKALGNGVVPQQAALALTHLLDP